MKETHEICFASWKCFISWWCWRTMDILISSHLNIPRCGPVETYAVGLFGVLNLSNYEQDKESAIIFCFVRMCNAPKAYVWIQANNTSLWIRFINLSDLDADWLINCCQYEIKDSSLQIRFAIKWGQLPLWKFPRRSDRFILFSKCIKGLSCSLIIIQ